LPSEATRRPRTSALRQPSLPAGIGRPSNAAAARAASPAVETGQGRPESPARATTAQASLDRARRGLSDKKPLGRGRTVDEGAPPPAREADLLARCGVVTHDHHGAPHGAAAAGGLDPGDPPRRPRHDHAP
jgi:hypothetical protein